jgi:hypothetical protein
LRYTVCRPGGYYGTLATRALPWARVAVSPFISLLAEHLLTNLHGLEKPGSTR